MLSETLSQNSYTSRKIRNETPQRGNLGEGRGSHKDGKVHFPVTKERMGMNSPSKKKMAERGGTS